MGWDKLATTWAVFQGLLIGALPFLLIGVGIASLVRWFSPAGGWLRRLPADPLLGPLTGAALGFALPACECGNVPVARRLIASGVPMATAFGFLFAAPVLNPIVLASTWAAFPDRPWLLLARPLAALAIALALASLLRLLPEGKLLSDELLEERRLNQPLGQLSLLERRGGLLGERPQPPLGPQRMAAAEALGHGVREFLNLAILLVFGCAIASLVQTLVPRSWLLAVGDAPTLSILSLMLLAVLVSVCSSVDAFLALGFAAHVTPGALLAGLDVAMGQGRQRLPRRESASWLLGGMVAVAMLLLPPEPSFSDLAATRGSGQMLQEEISFVLPAGQRSLTDWVRLLRAAPDPQLYNGDPVRISGFVLAVPGQPPQLARLLVRCCLADATPIGLPVRWPQSRPLPKANQWLSIEGVMGIDSSDGQAHSLVLPRRISPIPRPKRPFEG